MLRTIVNLIKKPFYAKFDVRGKTLLLPLCIRMFYGIGYNPIASNYRNIRSLIVLLFLQICVTCGEIIFTHSVWGNFLMFTGLASLIFGTRASIVMGVIVSAHQKYKDAFFTFVQDIWISAEEDKEMNKKCERRLALARLVCYTKMSAVAVYIIEPFVANFSKDYADKDFPLTVDYWFTYRIPYVFDLLFLVNTLDISMRITFVANLDLTMNYYLVYTSARFDKLAEKILNINSEENCTDIELRKKLSLIIQTHNDLRGFVEKLQEMFTVSLLMQFIADVFVICVMGAQLAFMVQVLFPYFYTLVVTTESVSVTNLLDLLVFTVNWRSLHKYINQKIQIANVQVLQLSLPIVAYGRIGTFLMTVYAQQYVNSSSGERLSEASLKLGDAAYHSEWVNKIPILGPSVALIIQYSQRPVILSGCGFFDLNMMTFSAVCRRSVSYFMLLRTLFE